MALDHQTDDSDAEADFENIWLRLLHMVIIAVLMSMASTILGFLESVRSSVYE